MADKYVGEFDKVTTPIYKWSAYLGLVIGGAIGAQNGYATGAGLGYFIIHIIGYALGGAFCACLLAIPVVILASAATYVTRNPKEFVILLVVVGVIAFIWLSRNTQFH
jgi:hypothetical protein